MIGEACVHHPNRVRNFRLQVTGNRGQATDNSRGQATDNAFFAGRVQRDPRHIHF